MSDTSVQDRTDAVQAPIVFKLEKKRYEGALFNIEEDDRTENGPLMSGSITLTENDPKSRVPLSAFLATADTTGTEYLNLSLGGKDGVHYYGRLFRQVERRSDKSPDYSGFIYLLAVEPGAPKPTNEQWDKADRLQVYGRRVKNLNEGSRIALDVVPQRSREPANPEDVAF